MFNILNVDYITSELDDTTKYAGIIRFYGITQNPETKDYMMVLDYANGGSLRNYLDTNYDKLSWKGKFGSLWNIAIGLDAIHKNELIHRDFHIGNILSFSYESRITDMGLCKPADYIWCNKKQYIWSFTLYCTRSFKRTKLY